MKILILSLIMSSSVFAQGMMKKNCVTTEFDPVTDKDGAIQTVTTIVCKEKKYTKDEIDKLKEEEEKAVKKK